MAKAQGIDEDLKERDPLAWVGAMNNLNQLAQRAHYSGQMDTEKIDKALEEVGEIFDHVKQWWKY
ncbi:MAG: hypothetical protein J6A62_04245 [Oscillospiraceae bacterium]|nr:hypothetical protein [Oscillospiraceae bacterium]